MPKITRSRRQCFDSGCFDVVFCFSPLEGSRDLSSIFIHVTWEKKKTALCDSHMATEVTVRPPCRDNSCQPVRSTWWDVMKQSCSVSFTGKQIALSVTFDYNQRWWLCSQREAEPRPTSLKTASEVCEDFEIKTSPLLNTRMSSCWDPRYAWNAIKIKNKKYTSFW